MVADPSDIEILKQRVILMPCYFPRQVPFYLCAEGKKRLIFSYIARFEEDHKQRVLANPDRFVSIPCSQCIGCRMRIARDWGLRCKHEADMHEENCFLTLTISPCYLDYLCPNGSLDKDFFHKFMKKLRNRFRDKRLRFFGCGEYGGLFGRPHYHLCLFGFDFPDKEIYEVFDNYTLYTSELLLELWPYGFSTVGSLNFDTAAYTARYCLKKVVGKDAAKHYKGRVPDYCRMSTRPGIGKPWFDKFGKTDVIDQNRCVFKGFECSVPRYYDKLWDRVDPDSLVLAKNGRKLEAQKYQYDLSDKRLEDRFKCQEAKMKKIIRRMESVL